MRFLKSVVLFALSVAAFTIRFFELFNVKNAVPFVLQMLLGWALFFSSMYQLAKGVQEVVTAARTRNKP